ncbi:MAG: putative baseplate assembly protein, partial [Xenococcus sp. (in: cyanobacteria)]
AALVHIFARFAEIIIERLNQVPDKNFLAFLDLLGASRLPPQPARVPLTFSLAAGTTVDAVVPKRTQVAAPPAEGEKDPVIFETERELVVSAAQLESIFVRDPQQDMYSDCSLIITNPELLGVPVFRGNQLIEHIFYIGHSKLLGFPEIENLKLKVNLSKALGTPEEIKWQIWYETENEANWQDIAPENDETQGFTQEGKNRNIEFRNMTAVPVTTVNSVTNRWLRCRLVTPITLANESQNGMVSANQLPEVEEIKLEATISSSDLLIETAFTNQLPIDLTKDFFPFGEKPKFGDTLYLANNQAFSQKDARITIDIILTNWASGVAPTFIGGNPKLKWEFWNGKKWMAIGTSTLEGGLPAGNNTFEDTTRAFTGYFEKVFLFSQGEYTDLTVQAISSDGTAFQLNEDTQEILYLGATERFKDINFSLATRGEGYTLIFEYFNGFQWIQLTEGEHNLEDNTSNWTADGRVEFTIPNDWKQTTINDATRYWIRIRTSTPPNSIAEAFFFQADRGHVGFEFPEPPVATMVNGVKDFWIRVRIISGNYGKEASYTNGFEAATFAPPSISSITVDHTLTIQEEPPEAIFTYNDAVYSNNLIQLIDNQNQIFPKPLIPFQATETDKQTLYFGFSLPSGRKEFFNRTISLFNSIANLKYGEKLVPISPNKSRRVGEAGVIVIHKFWLTNNTSDSVQFKLTVLGTKTNWETNVPESLNVEADSVKEVEVRVEIRTEAKLESSDRGFLQVSQVNSSIIDNATFETFVGKQLPKDEQIQLLWQYWNGKEWAKLTVRDETENFTRPGLIEFLPPTDFSPREDFNLPPRYWLRVQWVKGNYEVEPRLKRVLLNTTMAVQTITIQNEIIGSSDGNENQKFQTTRQPILAGQHLEVREPEIPSALEKQKIEKEEGENAITSISEATGRPQEIWVRWHQVKDFYQSETRDRHYILDNITGKITFGDGRNGLIPPRGKGNIRMITYQTGGGKIGNKPAKSIVQLKTTVPYVDRVINYEAATGGAEAETLDSLIERVPREIRHRKRAVTLEDYEDLAKLASPEVIRAKCIPLANLKADLLVDTKVTKLPGAVSVIIVPRSREVKPLPSLELIRSVQEYLEKRTEPTVNISVVGPLYVRVDITAEIALTSLEGASKVAQTVEAKLASFLHPLTGGFDEAGWNFGRQPYKSDFYRLLEGISEVDHVRSLDVKEEVDNLDEQRDVTEKLNLIKQTGRFLVYSGNHDISLTFVES